GRDRIVLLSIWDTSQHGYGILGIGANTIHVTNVFSKFGDVVGFRRLWSTAELFQNRFNIRRQCAVAAGTKHTAFSRASLLLGRCQLVQLGWIITRFWVGPSVSGFDHV